MNPFGRRFAAMLLGSFAAAASAVTASSFTDLTVHDGVEIGMVWNGSAGPVAFPLVEGKPVPHGDKRLVVKVGKALLDPRASRHELQVRPFRRRARRFSHVDTLPDGTMTFEIPFDLVEEGRKSDLAVTLLRDRGALGLDRLDILRMTYVPSEQLSVVSVNRYPDLTWQGCPAPCFRRPPGLSRITPEQWRQALEVVEVDRGGKRRVVGDFLVSVRSERPASIVYLVDASGSILLEGSGDPSKLMLEHFAAFPDEAYGSDKVRGVDRLAMLFFSGDVVGYYEGYPPGDGASAPIGAESRFFSPDALSSTWDDFCVSMRDRSAGPGTRLARLDDAWIAGSRRSLVSAGYELPKGEQPWAHVCARGATPTGILDRYRAAVRRCHLRVGCAPRPAGTDVLPALRQAAEDLDMLRHDVRTPEQTRDNQQVIILISDGIDAPFLAGDDAAREARYREMKKNVLRGKRFFFVDVHSDLVLTRMVIEALPATAPLYSAVAAGIGSQVEDAELALLLIDSLFLDDDRELRSRLLLELEFLPLDRAVPSAPVLRRVLDGVLYEELPPYKAFQTALQEVLPDEASAILAGRRSPPAWPTADDSWLSYLPGPASDPAGKLLRTRPDARLIRAHVEAVKAGTIEQFYDLAEASDGLAVPTAGCEHRTADGRLSTGSSCAFRKILDVLRGTLHVQYEPDDDREVRKVEIRLTSRGKKLLAGEGMRGAAIDSASFD